MSKIEPYLIVWGRLDDSNAHLTLNIYHKKNDGIPVYHEDFV